MTFLFASFGVFKVKRSMAQALPFSFWKSMPENMNFSQFILKAAANSDGGSGAEYRSTQSVLSVLANTHAVSEFHMTQAMLVAAGNSTASLELQITQAMLVTGTNNHSSSDFRISQSILKAAANGAANANFQSSQAMLLVASQV